MLVSASGDAFDRQGSRRFVEQEAHDPAGGLRDV
jgi:hypothetical protein